MHLRGCMTLMQRLPPVQGRLTAGRGLDALTWFRVGGAAEVLFQPADRDDLATFLANCPDDVPVTALGVGSNLLVRDGGVPGVVIRLGRGFNAIRTEGARVSAGAAALDAQVAVRAAEAGIGGLEFLRGIPGTLGGALAMNAGCYGTEIGDRLVSAEAIDRNGRLLHLDVGAMGFSYRSARAAEGVIFTGAVLKGTPADPATTIARMEDLLARREASQPVRSRTGGSTFRNPSGASSTGAADDDQALKAWSLIEAAGCRGLVVGDAQVSEKHCNFLINRGAATAADLETLGDTVRERVKAHAGVDLRWEIRRIGVIVTD